MLYEQKCQVLGPNPTSNQVPEWWGVSVEIDQKQAKLSTPVLGTES